MTQGLMLLISGITGSIGLFLLLFGLGISPLACSGGAVLFFSILVAIDSIRE